MCSLNFYSFTCDFGRVKVIGLSSDAFRSLHKQINFSHISVWQEKTTDSSAKSSSHLNVHPNGPSYAPPMMPIDTDDGISYKGLSKNLVFFSL